MLKVWAFQDGSARSLARLVTSRMQIPDEPSVTQSQCGSQTHSFKIRPIVYFLCSVVVTSRLPSSLSHSELLSQSVGTRPAFQPGVFSPPFSDLLIHIWWRLSRQVWISKALSTDCSSCSAPDWGSCSWFFQPWLFDYIFYLSHAFLTRGGGEWWWLGWSFDSPWPLHAV